MSTIAVVLLFAIAAILLIALYALREPAEPEPLERFLALIVKRVIIHTKDDRSLEGILLGVYADSVSLTDAYFHVNPEAKVPLEGYQVIPFANIEWVQELVENADARTQNT